MVNPMRRVSAVSVLAMAGLLLLPGGAAAATSNLAIYVPDIGAGCMFITAPADHTLALVWRDGSGAIKETASIPTGGAGDPLYCSDDNIVAVGDRIKVSDGPQRHKLTIPNVTAAINRVTDVMSGRGPAGTVLRIECDGSPFGQFEPCQYTKKVTVDSAGNWSVHIPFDMFGGFTMYARWKNSYGDLVYRKATVPYFQVFLNKGRFFGVTQPLSTGSVTVENSSHVEKGTGTGESGLLDGSFVGKLRNNAGHVATVVPGDFASSDVATDASFVVPDIQATATAADDRVRGHCELTDQYRGVWIEVYRGGQLRGAGFGGDNFGDFDEDLGSAMFRPVNIKVGDKVHVSCILGEGDRPTRVVVAQ